MARVRITTSRTGLRVVGETGRLAGVVEEEGGEAEVEEPARVVTCRFPRLSRAS